MMGPSLAPSRSCFGHSHRPQVSVAFGSVSIEIDADCIDPENAWAILVGKVTKGRVILVTDNLFSQQQS